VREAATLICIRQAAASSTPPPYLSRRALNGESTSSATRDAHDDPRDAVLFGDSDSNDASFASGWEVLMGQREVVNWIRSTGPGDLRSMRYPGEWAFAGGAVDEEDDGIEAAARRELAEEFGSVVPPDAHVQVFSVRQTRPIQMKSNIMYNYLAVDSGEEGGLNPWLRALDVDAHNRRLAERRARHASMVESGAFWEMSAAEREAVAPEVRCIRWIPLLEAAKHAYTSMNTGTSSPSVSFCLLLSPSVSVSPSLRLSVSPSLRLSVSPSLRLSLFFRVHATVLISSVSRPRLRVHIDECSIR
jgi:8-oxo-dGTP pyrophosphatase MutT (NUDIX family)